MKNEVQRLTEILAGIKATAQLITDALANETIESGQWVRVTKADAIRSSNGEHACFAHYTTEELLKGKGAKAQSAHGFGMVFPIVSGHPLSSAECLEDQEGTLAMTIREILIKRREDLFFVVRAGVGCTTFAEFSKNCQKKNN